MSRESCALDARAASFVRSRTPRTARPRLRTGLARPIIKRRTPRVAAPGVHVPRRRRLRLRWVAPRSLAKTGLRRKGRVRPDNAPGPDFVSWARALAQRASLRITPGDDCRPGSRGEMSAPVTWRRARARRPRSRRRAREALTSTGGEEWVPRSARLDALMEFPGTGDLPHPRNRSPPRRAGGGWIAPERRRPGHRPLVIDGEYAAAAEAIELGSGLLHPTSTGVVILTGSILTLDYVRLLLRGARRRFQARPTTPGTRRLLRAITSGVLGRSISALWRDPPFCAPVSVTSRATWTRTRKLRMDSGCAGRPHEVRFDCDANALVVVAQRAGDSYLSGFLVSRGSPARCPMVGVCTSPLSGPLHPDEEGSSARCAMGCSGWWPRTSRNHRAIRQALDIFGRGTRSPGWNGTVPAVDAYLTQAPAVVA